MATYRERREAKAERLRGWAEKRIERANAALNSQPELGHDWAFITQPGHIPERARMNARDDRAMASLSKAASMNGRAAGIEDQLDHAIYDDDPDAIERLRERIAQLEARHEATKARPHEAYELSNSNGNIRRYRARLAKLDPSTVTPDTRCCKHAARYHRGDPDGCLFCGCLATPKAPAPYRGHYQALYKRMGLS